MIAAIADTHTTIWYLFSDPRLGSGASAFIDEAASKGEHVGVSAITIVEIVYLMEKGRIPSSALADLRRAILDEAAVLRCVALDERIAMKMMEVPREAVPDLPDGVIVATALLHGVPILSRDRRIQASGLQTIW
jgi:PIN domain nuclease of toxin-antitoxin system